MADRMAAEIYIGGNLPAAAVKSLFEAIVAEGVSLEYGGAQFIPENVSDLMNARTPRWGALLLFLSADDAAWGEFSTLEPLLQELQLPYTRLTEGKYDYQAERVEFRPGMAMPEVKLTDPDGNPVVLAVSLQSVKHALCAAADVDATIAKQLASAALQILDDLLPKEHPPLPDFQVSVA